MVKTKANPIKGLLAVCEAIARQSKPLKANKAGKTKADPTGQQKNRKKGTLTLDRRLNKSEREVKALFRAIPKKRKSKAVIANAESTIFYDYGISEIETIQLQSSIEFILNNELLETQTGVMQMNWYWKDNIEQPYRQGTAESLVSFNQLIAGAAIAGVLVKGLPPRPVPIEQVLLSQNYREALNKVYVSNFESIKTLSQRTASQVIQRINAGIDAGDTPTVISKTISERFDVARSSAKRIADTEINKAYNDSKIRANDVAASETGLRAGVIHISALTTTTRNTHAARHGNAYTTVDQLQWWDNGSNRINCKCTTISVLIDSKGKVVQTETQEKIKAEKAFFD